jgi:hypothetical protein
MSAHYRDRSWYLADLTSSINQLHTSQLCLSAHQASAMHASTHSSRQTSRALTVERTTAHQCISESPERLRSSNTAPNMSHPAPGGCSSDRCDTKLPGRGIATGPVLPCKGVNCARGICGPEKMRGPTAVDAGGWGTNGADGGSPKKGAPRASTRIEGCGTDGVWAAATNALAAPMLAPCAAS